MQCEKVQTKQNEIVHTIQIETDIELGFEFVKFVSGLIASPDNFHSVIFNKEIF